MRPLIYVFLLHCAAQWLPANATQVRVGSFSGTSRYLHSMQSAKDLVEWIALADRQGVRILATPEAYVGGYPLWNTVGQTMDVAGNEKRKTVFINAARPERIY